MKSVCADHVDDVALKQLIRDYATETSCSYCNISDADGESIAVSFDDFMSRFMVGVHHRYARADDEAVLLDEGEYVGATTYESEEHQTVWVVRNINILFAEFVLYRSDVLLGEP
ncbi:MAG: hypothetical protein JO236_20315 [Mycobacterium sp.]|uniref:HEPN-associated N-terminal domain-containing protein n=1 Tax=Mycobacterium sp. TaxID=1785 RepID=UPI001EC16D15|nr:HEPN-associated N-terminal domain-containing protein [Mycobacterium sp.]MBW0019874.1 hypothetical protein [Mycobacterium sp.]